MSPLDTKLALPILIPPSLAHGASGCGRHGHRLRSPYQAHVLVRTPFHLFSAVGGNSAKPRLRRPTRRLAASRKTQKIDDVWCQPTPALAPECGHRGGLVPPHNALSAFSTLFGATKRVRPPRRRAPGGETPAFENFTHGGTPRYKLGAAITPSHREAFEMGRMAGIDRRAVVNHCLPIAISCDRLPFFLSGEHRKLFYNFPYGRYHRSIN